MARKCLVNYFVILYSFVTVTKNLCHCNTINFDGKIAGNLSIFECVNGSTSPIANRDTEMYITTSQFARKMGYPTEEHVVQTEDGYILTLHRIPAEEGAPPVFLQHGLVCSSFDWVVAGKERALAFILADRGYDVWLGNYRGSTYSRCHAKYTTSSYEFWNFSWHEMGIHDLPAMITHVTETTGQKIIYIGHSMGTTAFFVMAIERPDVASQVKAMMALAPVAFIGHATSPAVTTFSPFERQLEVFLRFLRWGEFLAQSPLLKRVIEFACSFTTLQRRICVSIVFYPIGYTSQQFNYTLAPEILYHFPAGSSVKVAAHYAQSYNSKRFRYFDYGAEKNSKLYNSAEPPEYDLSKITVPIGIVYSDSDEFTPPVDALHTYEQLPNKIVKYHVEYPEFHHLDYFYAIDAPKLVFEKLLSIVENYR